MNMDLLLIIPHLIICCLICLFIYTIYKYINKLTTHFEIISKCFTEMNQHICLIELAESEQDAKLGSIFERLNKLVAQTWK